MPDFFIKIRFYGNLNDFLPIKKRKKAGRKPVSNHQTVKDVLESEGIPHAEVNVIRVNGRCVSFSYKPGDGDRIEIFPRNHSFKSPPTLTLLPQLPARPLFLLDEHLGKLAKLMRMCGIDTQLFHGTTDRELADMASRMNRIVLTRDVELLKRKNLKRGYWVRDQDPEKQLIEVFRRFDLFDKIKPFFRCMLCNGLIKKAGRKTVTARLPSRTRAIFNEYYQCNSCGKIYWKGSHYQRMELKIGKLVRTGKALKKTSGDFEATG
ncbi:MAG TPA: Mut7-C RNAse domain-containing protein [Cyclobacteriaceae bacterium]|nr:Mut7-C RNAse domain-containing protein [Cyclobacteriaceae bacterium]